MRGDILTYYLKVGAIKYIIRTYGENYKSLSLHYIILKVKTSLNQIFGHLFIKKKKIFGHLITKYFIDKLPELYPNPNSIYLQQSNSIFLPCHS